MRRKKKPTAAGLLQVGIAGVLIIVLVLFVIWYADGLNTYEPGTVTFRYIAGVKVDYSEDARYHSRKDSGISVIDGELEEAIGSAPILYEGMRKLTIPVNMILMTPAQGLSVRRLNYFTDIVENNGIISVEKDGKMKMLLGGFLFDGENVYVFLENTTLMIGSREIQLEPLSYAEVVYGQTVEYYNSADGSYQHVGTNGVDVKAVAASGYTLDLGRDIVDTGDGDILIYSVVDNVPVMAMED